MEKQAVIKPGVTPDTDHRLPVGEKTASTADQTKQLDDDSTKRLADAAAKLIR